MGLAQYTIRINGGLNFDIFSLYQGRSWAKYVTIPLLNTVSSNLNVVRTPSPLISQGWPLSWARQVLRIPETKINELRGLDATIYSLFLRACSRLTSRLTACDSSPFFQHDLFCCIHSLLFPFFFPSIFTSQTTRYLNGP